MIRDHAITNKSQLQILDSVVLQLTWRRMISSLVVDELGLTSSLMLLLMTSVLLYFSVFYVDFHFRWELTLLPTLSTPIVLLLQSWNLFTLCSNWSDTKYQIAFISEFAMSSSVRLSSVCRL